MTDYYKKIGDAFNLANIAFRSLMDASDELKAKAKDILILNGVKDPEELDKNNFIKWYGIEEYRERVVKSAEELQKWIDALISLGGLL